MKDWRERKGERRGDVAIGSEDSSTIDVGSKCEGEKERPSKEHRGSGKRGSHPYQILTWGEKQEGQGIAFLSDFIRKGRSLQTCAGKLGAMGERKERGVVPFQNVRRIEKKNPEIGKTRITKGTMVGGKVTGGENLATRERTIQVIPGKGTNRLQEAGRTRNVIKLNN